MARIRNLKESEWQGCRVACCHFLELITQRWMGRSRALVFNEEDLCSPDPGGGIITLQRKRKEMALFAAYNCRREHGVLGRLGVFPRSGKPSPCLTSSLAKETVPSGGQAWGIKKRKRPTGSTHCDVVLYVPLMACLHCLDRWDDGADRRGQGVR